MKLWELVKNVDEQNTELHKLVDEQALHIKELREQAQPSEAVTALLDLLEPDIKRSEQIILHDERLIKLIELYREIRPGGVKASC